MHFMILLRRNKKLLFVISYKSLIYEEYEFHLLILSRLKKSQFVKIEAFIFFSSPEKPSKPYI